MGINIATSIWGRVTGRREAPGDDVQVRLPVGRRLSVLWPLSGTFCSWPVCGLWWPTGPFPWARHLDRSALKIILGDRSVNPMETCITKVAPGWAQQLRKRKNWLFLKTETRSSGWKGPISFCLGQRAGVWSVPEPARGSQTHFSAAGSPLA